MASPAKMEVEVAAAAASPPQVYVNEAWSKRFNPYETPFPMIQREGAKKSDEIAPGLMLLQGSPTKS